MTTEKLHFKTSSGIKSIVGKDLITDKFVAIFELVKNSYDAGAALLHKPICKGFFSDIIFK
jgi:hypothetical protein